MAIDPHVVKVLDNDFPYRDKAPVEGHINCVLHARAMARRLQVTVHPSRALLRNQIHEVILTDEPDAGLGATVNRVAFLAFFEVDAGGMVLVGDRVEIEGQPIGQVAGFDLTHADNHLNICVKVPNPMRTGEEMGLHSGDRISFVFQGPDQAKMVANK